MLVEETKNIGRKNCSPDWYGPIWPLRHFRHAQMGDRRERPGEDIFDGKTAIDASAIRKLKDRLPGYSP
jgi:hypothetical protein